MRDDGAPKPSDVRPPDSEPRKVPGDRAGQELPTPTLEAYYRIGGPKSALWLKAVQAAKLKSFGEDDVEAARQGLAVHDPQLRRTVALSQARSTSTAVQKWVSDATRTSLAAHLGTVRIDPYAPAAEQLARIADVLSPRLRSKNKAERSRAENLLRLAVRQLSSQRQLDPGEALRVLFKPLRDRSRHDTRLAGKELAQRILTAGLNPLSDLSLAYSVAVDRIAAAHAERRNAHDRAERLEAELLRVRREIDGLNAGLAEAKQAASEADAENVRLRQSMHDQRQVGAHGKAAIIARFRSLLAARIDPLLSDSADALEIDPPIVEVAKDRIESARAITKGEIEWLDGSSG
jgi:hypothetical protein